MQTLVRVLTLEPLERRPGRVFVAIGLVFAVFYVIALGAFPRVQGRIIDGDTIQYYAYLRSLVIDRDVDFTNDYRLLYPAPESGENVWLYAKTPTGLASNHMSIGPALLWAPAFLFTYACLLVLRPLGILVPLDGVAAPFLLSAGIAGILYATLGAFLCYRSCRLLVADAPAFWAALVAWLGTPAVYYSLVSPAYSHATSMFASALFCFVWLKTRGSDGMGRYLALGVLAGLAALVRWQDGIVILLPLVELAMRLFEGRASVPTAAARALAMVAGSVAMLLPQLVAWHSIYGQFLVMPQGDSFMQWSNPALVSVLFSLRHGLFSWTPVVLVSFIGLGCLTLSDAVLGWSVAAILALAVYVNASVSDWWAGEAFGARRFIGYTVFFALGLAALFDRRFFRSRPVLLRWTAIAAVAYNLLFLLQYQLFMRGFRTLAPYPTTVQQVLFERLALPWHLLRAWLSS